MKAILKLSFVVLVSLLFTTAATVTSCKKDKTCKGIVHVVDTANVAVGAATVVLDAPDGDISYTGFTDASGDVTFEVTLPAIFDVTVTKPGVGAGTGVLRLDEPGKEDAVTITIQ